MENNPDTNIVIKSTLPIGYTEVIGEKFNVKNIIWCPKFLREGYALYDNLYPSRIVLGTISQDERLIEIAYIFAALLQESAIKKIVKTLFMSVTEAEAVKLFANVYLALRVSYFNELDINNEMKELNSKQIITGVCLDPRIGMYYNNPSFGYGGYCLSKDTKQLLAEYSNIPNSIIKAIVTSDTVRKNFIAKQILDKSPGVVGIYRLAMKSASDNIRNALILGIIKRLVAEKIEVIFYEPLIVDEIYLYVKVINELDVLKQSFVSDMMRN